MLTQVLEAEGACYQKQRLPGGPRVSTRDFETGGPGGRPVRPWARGINPAASVRVLFSFNFRLRACSPLDPPSDTRLAKSGLEWSQIRMESESDSTSAV